MFKKRLEMIRRHKCFGCGCQIDVDEYSYKERPSSSGLGVDHTNDFSDFFRSIFCGICREAILEVKQEAWDAEDKRMKLAAKRKPRFTKEWNRLKKAGRFRSFKIRDEKLIGAWVVGKQCYGDERPADEIIRAEIKHLGQLIKKFDKANGISNKKAAKK